MAAKTQRKKHVPHRTCVACRQKIDKRRLTRIVRTPDEGVLVDLTGKRNGRGAYLCDNPLCWDRALSGSVLENALQVRLSPAERALIITHRPVDEVPGPG